jgi:hypothetical protein
LAAGIRVISAASDHDAGHQDKGQSEYITNHPEPPWFTRSDFPYTFSPNDYEKGCSSPLFIHSVYCLTWQRILASPLGQEGGCSLADRSQNQVCFGLWSSDPIRRQIEGKEKEACCFLAAYSGPCRLTPYLPCHSLWQTFGDPSCARSNRSE